MNPKIAIGMRFNKIDLKLTTLLTLVEIQEMITPDLITLFYPLEFQDISSILPTTSKNMVIKYRIGKVYFSTVVNHFDDIAFALKHPVNQHPDNK